MNKNKKRYTIIGIVVVALLLVIGIGHHVAKNGGLTAPKTVSLKTPGERVWLRVGGGLQKDSSVQYVDVLKNGKFIQYAMFDKDITLGKTSKMSNSELIRLAKKQDRKYFEESAAEVRALRDGGSQLGYNDDLMGDDDLKADFNQGAYLYMRGTGSDTDDLHYNQLITYDQYKQEKNSPEVNKATVKGLINSGYPQDNSEFNQITQLDKEIRNKRFSWILKNMKDVKYLAPKWQSLSYKNTTDDSGNDITTQTIRYNTIINFSESGTINNNISKLSDDQKQKILKVANDAQGSHRDFNTNKFISDVRAAFDDDYFRVVTKGLVKPRTFSQTRTLEKTVHQRIYDSNYIGYKAGDEIYMVTKAQNDNQRAVFTK